GHCVNSNLCWSRYTCWVSCINNSDVVITRGYIGKCCGSLEGAAINTILKSSSQWYSDFDSSCWNGATWLYSNCSSWCNRWCRHCIYSYWCWSRYAGWISCINNSDVVTTRKNTGKCSRGLERSTIQTIFKCHSRWCTYNNSCCWNSTCWLYRDRCCWCNRWCRHCIDSNRCRSGDAGWFSGVSDSNIMTTRKNTRECCRGLEGSTI